MTASEISAALQRRAARKFAFQAVKALPSDATLKQMNAAWITKYNAHLNTK